MPSDHIANIINEHKFLSAPGQLGGLIAARDWSNTSLGPISGWPQSLKTAVSLMLSSRQPMWIGWGADVTFLYNDAYIDVLSLAKHPQALGLPVAEVWSEIWDICGPLADRVFAFGEATNADDVRLFMSRGDFLEENFFSFSYSPIRDESGNVAGLFCPNLDVTAKHLNARRLRTLSEIASRSLMEKTVGAAADSVIATLANNPDDIAFALLYLSQEQAGQAAAAGLKLWQATGAAVDTVPATVTLLEDGAPTIPAATASLSVVLEHALATTLRSGLASVVDFPFAETLPVGLANLPVRQALVLPLMASSNVVGAVVLGVSPVRKLDHDYRSFFDLVATQCGNAIQNARASEEERLRLDMLAEVDRAKTQFFSNVSHEFRTPLTLMLAPLEEALEDAASLPPVQRQRLELMQRNAVRLQKLVNTLLEFSRVQAGRAQAVFEPTDLAALTSDLASSFRSTVESTGMQLIVDCAPLSAPVYIDVAMWEKIILNLLSNAFKFTFEGAITVSMHEAPVQGTVTVTIADSGIGIAADQLPRLFERFHRIDSARSRTHEGTGIGLALVHDLVALQSGVIKVDSEPGRGTRFHITLPLGTAHLDPAQLRPSQVGTSSHVTSRAYVAEAAGWLGVPLSPALPELEVVTIPSASALSGRVLIVDDNADMRDYLCRLLKPHWHIELAGNGVEALAAIKLHRPDLIVSDVMMPQLDGFGLLAALRADAATHELPVLLLSARAGEEARLEGLQAGASDYLVKPFSGRELVARIDALLLRQRVRTIENSATRRMQAIFSQAPVGIAILRGPEHVFELANERYQELVERSTLIGLTIRQALPEVEGQQIFELLDAVYATGIPYMGRSVRVDILRGNPARPVECYFDFVYQPLCDDHGTIEGIAVVVFEVTELASAKRAAEAGSLAKDEFLAMLGHELRNPLAPIVTALQLMRLRGVDTAKKERAVIERQVQHLVALVDDLLDVSRVTQGKIELRRKVIELGEVVANAIETISPLIEGKLHHLTVDVDSSGLLVQADPARLRQVVANLLSNAAKYTEQGGRLRIAAWRESSDVVLTVSDNGIGISTATLPTIFDLFVQERQALSRSQGGLGLGLAIARSMMALHGGSVEAHSEGLGMGSTFTLRLPAYQPLASTTEDETASASVVETDNVIRQGLAILIVDDNEDAAQVLQDMLEIQGHRVKVVLNGPAALQLAPLFQPDVCLLDIGLPGMDGYELAQRLRQLPGGDLLRLFAVTGYGQSEDRRRAAEHGFDEHFVKPLDIARLNAML
ncbi:ATP-binding protein [Undibacterium sp. Di27W]|uniref:ATP-binding protein n=1 Tax=Undibacterium sp. Di27W TaxID=3413036 RepID=UPI003BF26110